MMVVGREAKERRGADAVALGSEGMDGMRRGRPSGAGNPRVLVDFFEHKIAGAGATGSGRGGRVFLVFMGFMVFMVFLGGLR